MEIRYMAKPLSYKTTNKYPHWQTLGEKDFIPSDVVRNLGNLFGITDPRFLRLVEDFILTLRSVELPSEPYKIQMFYDGCKARYEELYKLVSNLLNLSDVYQVRLSRANGKPFVKVSSETLIEFLDDDDDPIVTLDLKLTGYPKIYGLLSKAVVQSIIAVDELGIDPDGYKTYLIPYLQIILSVGQLFDDLRGGTDYIDFFEQTALKKLETESEPLKTIPDYINEIKRDISLNRRAPLYIRDIARAKRLIKLDDWSEEDYHISLRSTGSKLNGNTLRGITASIYETDYYVGSRLDELIGFKSYYRDEAHTFKLTQGERVSMTIEQHKLKRRVIHLSSNPIQDRFSWFHRRLEKFLLRIPSDCTFDQDAGRRFAQRASQRARQELKNIYSSDISSATDTISREYQRLVLSIFVGDELADEWIKFTDSSGTFKFRNGQEKKFISKRGQPQGYKSSFPAFALAHHILVRIAMIKSNLKDVDPNDICRILGDDSEFEIEDPERIFLKNYIETANEFGWEINLNKGCYYFIDESGLPVAEFAKVRYCDGKALSPLPIMLTLGLSSIEGIMPAFLFISKHLGQRDIRDLISICDSIDSTIATKFFLIQLVRSKVGPWMHILDTSKSRITDEQRIICLIHYLRTQLYRTTLGLWLPSEYAKSYQEGMKDAKKESLILYNYILKAEENDSADLDSRHKIWYLMDRQAYLIESIEKVIKDASLSYAGLAINVSDKEQQILIRAIEIILDYKDKIYDDYQETLDDAIKILSRFNPRSDSLYSRQQSQMIAVYATSCIDDMKIDFTEVKSIIENIEENFDTKESIEYTTIDWQTSFMEFIEEEDEFTVET